MQSSEFERDTAVERVAENLWRGEMVPGWRIGEVPFGGYVLAMAARVLAQALPQPDPLSVHILYTAPSIIGPAEFLVEHLRDGKKTSHGLVRVMQAGQLRALVTASYTNLHELQGENWCLVERPEITPFEDCVPQGEHGVEMRQRIHQCFTSGAEIFKRQEPDGSGCFNGWLSLADGAATDALTLLLFADAYPPPVFTLFGPLGWVPTIELTVQVRRRPCAGPIQVRFRTRYLSDGVMEEDGELWDSRGELVALSRQTGKVRVPRKS